MRGSRSCRAPAAHTGLRATSTLAMGRAGSVQVRRLRSGACMGGQNVRSAQSERRSRTVVALVAVTLLATAMLAAPASVVAAADTSRVVYSPGDQSVYDEASGAVVFSAIG